MKTWLIEHKRQLLAVGMVAIIAVAFCLGRRAGIDANNRKAYAALWEAIVALPDPEQCALCNAERGHQALSLMNLSTGEIGQMEVYVYGVTKQGKLDPREAQFSGTFNFQQCAGLTAIRDTDFHTCTVYLPEARELMNPAHFCKECRQLLARAGLEGYVILDLYDQDNVQAYPLRYEIIRDYRVSVSSRKDGGPEVCVTGLLEY